MNGVVEIIPADATVPEQNVGVKQINPKLVITSDSRNLRLAWPISATNYVLEATTNLSQSFTMFGYTETTNIDAGVITVMITNPGPQMFFRLCLPSP
jgi:hypothetical protein